jgi:hypothetical protein
MIESGMNTAKLKHTLNDVQSTAGLDFPASNSWTMLLCKQKKEGASAAPSSKTRPIG